MRLGSYRRANVRFSPPDARLAFFLGELASDLRFLLLVALVFGASWGSSFVFAFDFAFALVDVLTFAFALARFFGDTFTFAFPFPFALVFFDAAGRFIFLNCW